jgi:two-component system chemotaxis response regulator CheY
MRVLIVEDDPMSALFLRRTLEAMGHMTLVASDGLEAWELIQREEIRLVISDWMMPRMDGLDLCRRIRERPDPVYTYVVVVTAKRQRQDRIEALQAGADDLLSKPFDQGELMARAQVAQRILTMQEELQARSRELEAMRDALALQNEHLAQIAICDSLTGLKNRRYLREVLDASFSFSLRQRLPLSVVMIDVDQFKDYNDAFGHPAGDAVLTTLGAMFQENCREHDLVARYGGEEFVILLPATEMAGARLVCERLRVMIERHCWACRPITASFGVTTLGLGTQNSDQLIEEADQALYHSKRRGRNQVTHYQELMAALV